MSFDAAFQDRLDGLARQPAARGPATVGEIWDTTWRASALDTMSGAGEPRRQAYMALVDKLEAEAGQPLRDQERAAGLNLSHAVSFDEKITMLGRLVDRLPEDKRGGFAELRDVESESRKRAAKLEKEVQEVAAASYGLSGMATGFLAGVARQMVEPVNVASLPLGAVRGASLLATMRIEAGVNMGAQAIQEPFIQSGRASLGLEAGFAKSAESIAMAGIGAAGLSATFRGIGWLAGKAFQAGRAPVTEALSRRNLSLEDFQAAARHQEARDVVDAQAPHQEAGAIHLQAERVEAASVAMERGKPIPEETPAAAPSPPRLDMSLRFTGDPAAEALSAGARLGGLEVSAMPAHHAGLASGGEIAVKPQVVDLDRLISSDDPRFPAELQPRDRKDRAASELQITAIASDFKPWRMGYAPEVDRGAPIVNGDGVVESGNGRIMAMRRIYETEPQKAADYRAWIEAQGVDTSGMSRPVLVRERLTPLDADQLQAFTVVANKGSTLEMSASELAMADARIMTPELMARIANPGDLAAVANVPFVREFVGRLPEPERAKFATAEGELSQDGLKRIQNAIIGKAYSDADLLARVTESTDGEVKSVVRALVNVAGDWAKLRLDIEAGRVVPEMDVTPELMEAVRLTADLRARGESLGGWLSQLSMFDGPPPAILGFMRMMIDGETGRAASIQRMTERLNWYIDQARQVSTEPGLALGLNKVNVDDIQARALARPEDRLAIPGDAGDGAGDAAGGAGARRPGADGAGRPDTAGGAGDAGPAPDRRIIGYERAPEPDQPASLTRTFDGQEVTLPDAAHAALFDLGEKLASGRRLSFDDLKQAQRLHATFDGFVNVEPELGINFANARHAGEMALAYWRETADYVGRRGGDLLDDIIANDEARVAWLKTGRGDRLADAPVIEPRLPADAPARAAEPMPARAAEATPAGNQLLIEGVRPVTDADRMAVEAARPLSGGDAAMPAGGLFDEVARAQPDLFAAPEVKAALSRLDAALQGRAGETFHLPGPDGQVRQVRAGDLLRDIGYDAGAMKALKDCMGGGA
jgi:hypothetical protein